LTFFLPAKTNNRSRHGHINSNMLTRSSIRGRQRYNSLIEGCTILDLWAKVTARCSQDNIDVNLDQNMKRYLVPFIIQVPSLKLKYKSAKIKAVELLKEPVADIERETKLYAPEEMTWELAADGFESQFPKTKEMLVKICQTRGKGITQTQLAEACKVDAKDTFRFLKPLIAVGIVKKFLVSSNGSNTNFLLHRKFLKYSEVYQTHMAKSETLQKVEDLQSALELIPAEGLSPSVSKAARKICADYATLRKKISMILKSARNQIMTCKDLMGTLVC
jgi:B-block binding subunit of TFIIIC